MYETLEAVQVESRKVVDGDIKVYFTLLSLTLALTLNRNAQITSLIIFSALSMYAAWRYYFKLLITPLAFLAAGTAVILFTLDGRTIAEFWVLRVTDNSLNTAVSVFIRSLASLSILLYLALTTSIPELVSAAKKLRLPDFFVEMLLLIYRAVQTLLDEAGRFDKAASSRLGYVSFKSTLRTTSILAYSLFLRSLSRADKFEVAMSARCYAGEFPVLEVRNRGFAICFATLLLVTLSWWFG